MSRSSYAPDHKPSPAQLQALVRTYASFLVRRPGDPERLHAWHDYQRKLGFLRDRFEEVDFTSDESMATIETAARELLARTSRPSSSDGSPSKGSSLSPCHSPLAARAAGRAPRLARAGKPAPLPPAHSVRVENETPYDTRDLAAFFAKGLRAMGARVPKIIRCIPIASASRGVANVGRHSQRLRQEGSRSPQPSGGTGGGTGEAHSLVLALPVPSKMTLRRLARLLEHEVRHTFGEEHKDMTTKVYWSLGPLPAWARGARVRYDNGRILR